VGRPLWREDGSVILMLLALARAVFLGSESLGTRDHILLSQIWDFPFIASYDSQGHGEVFDPASTWGGGTDDYCFLVILSRARPQHRKHIRCLAMEYTRTTEKTPLATPVLLLRACIAAVAYQWAYVSHYDSTQGGIATWAESLFKSW
jgi:hypothetical protein